MFFKFSFLILFFSLKTVVADFDTTGNFYVKYRQIKDRDLNPKLIDDDTRTLTRTQINFDFDSEEIQGRLSPFFVGYFAENATSGSKLEYISSTSDKTTGFGVHEAFVKWRIDDDLYMDIGRKEFTVDRGHFVGSPSFNDVGRAFDGIWFENKQNYFIVDNTTLFFTTLSENNSTGASSPGFSNTSLGRPEYRDIYLTGVNFHSEINPFFTTNLSYIFKDHGTTNNGENFMNASDPSNSSTYANAGLPFSEKYLHTLSLDNAYVLDDIFKAHLLLGKQVGHLRRIDIRDQVMDHKISSWMGDFETKIRFKELNTEFKLGYLYAPGPKSCSYSTLNLSYDCIEPTWKAWVPLYGNDEPYLGRLSLFHMTNIQSLRLGFLIDPTDSFLIHFNFFDFKKEDGNAPAPSTAGLPHYKNNGNQFPSVTTSGGNELVRTDGTELGYEMDVKALYRGFKAFEFSVGASIFNPGEVYLDQSPVKLIWGQTTWIF